MLDHLDENTAIRIPITEEMRVIAKAFAEVQPSLEKATQLERNTLAVLAMDTYLKWQNYSTDLSASDSWNPSTQLLGDVADLMIKNLGRIECRPVLAGEKTCPLPPEVWLNRIGYIVVQLPHDYSEATILGFSPPFDPEDPLEELFLSELSSLNELIYYLDRLEKGQHVLEETGSPEVEQIRQMWTEPYSRLMLITQLERIYRTEAPNKWRVKGEKVLSGRVLEGVIVREEIIPNDRIELQGIAERLLKQLATIWDESLK